MASRSPSPAVKPEAAEFKQEPAEYEERESSPAHVKSDENDEKPNEEDGDDAEGSEDDDDEEDEDDAPTQHRRKRRKRTKGNRFLDLEVEVDEDEDEQDEEDDDDREFLANNDFIANDTDVYRKQDGQPDQEQDSEDEVAHRDLDHRRIHREEIEAHKMAQEIKDRHRARRAAGDSAFADFAPRSVLLPGVNDPNIWRVKCKIGRERDLIMSIFRKAVEKGVSITSAFQRDGLAGQIYVEARSEAAVKEAVHGLVGIYVSTPFLLVPLQEMPDLLKSRRKEIPLVVGGWVRIKKGKYKNDLAQVDEIIDNSEMVTLKVVPRIDLNPREEETIVGIDGKKRKKAAVSSVSGFRPPQRFFNPEEVKRIHGLQKVLKDAEGWHFGADVYVKGYLIKDFRLNTIQREDVNPSIDEITRFIGDTTLEDNPEGLDRAAAAKTGLDLSLIAEAAKAAQELVLQPGDSVVVFEGDQKGVHGTVESLGQEVVMIKPAKRHVDLIGTIIEIPTRSVRKAFKAGDHIRVLRGKNVNESGLVVKIKDETVTFFSDLSGAEVTVFAKDVREAAEVGGGTNNMGRFEIHDLVQLDQETSGVIFKVEPDSFRILDQNGGVRVLKPNQISNKIEERMSVATDSEGFPLRAGDMVKEVGFGGGANREGRTGRVLHVYRSRYAFLHDRDILENGGVFVSFAQSLTSVAPRGTKGADLTKMNPAIAGGAPAAPNPMMMMGRGRREESVGAHITIIRGGHKGKKGIVKDINGPLARIELHTSSKILTIEKDKLGALDRSGQLVPLAQWEMTRMGGRREGGQSQGYGGAPGAYGSATNTQPLGNRGNLGTGTTPYYTGGKTPAYASGKTPAYQGGKTPAYGGGFGGATPYGGGFGGATPGYGGVGGATPAYGGDAWNPSSKTPAYQGGYGGQDQFGTGSGTPAYYNPPAETNYNAPTPYTTGPRYDSAPTPGMYAAPTPGAAYHAPTPGAYHAPTPGAYNAPTPGVYSAPTPGAYSAPTPGAYTAPTPGP